MAEMQSDKPKVTLHWLEKSRAQRIIWLLQECKDLDWDIKVYKRQSDMLAPPALKQVHPLGKSPVITVESPATTTPVVLAESAAIVEYLCDYFAPHLVPKRYRDGQEGMVGGESEEWLRYRFYMHYAEGSLMSLLMISVFMDQIRDSPVPFFIKPITRGIAAKVDAAYLTANFQTHFAFLESQLATSPNDGKFLCGAQLTAADILLSFPIIAAAQKKVDRTAYPKLVAYAEMLEAQEGYVASVKKIEAVSGEAYATF